MHTLWNSILYVFLTYINNVYSHSQVIYILVFYSFYSFETCIFVASECFLLTFLIHRKSAWIKKTDLSHTLVVPIFNIYIYIYATTEITVHLFTRIIYYNIIIIISLSAVDLYYIRIYVYAICSRDCCTCDVIYSRVGIFTIYIHMYIIVLNDLCATPLSAEVIKRLLRVYYNFIITISKVSVSTLECPTIFSKSSRHVLIRVLRPFKYVLLRFILNRFHNNIKLNKHNVNDK